MADFCGFQSGAGEGNRTLVVSLGSLGRLPEMAEIREFGLFHSANAAGTGGES